MAKSSSPRPRRPHSHRETIEPEIHDHPDAAPSATATSVAEAPLAPAPAPQSTVADNQGNQSIPAAPPIQGNQANQGHSSSQSADVGSFDAETNAKYESVKGGKLYIKDLQKMEIPGLHEIARQENIQDYIGLKKQDLIFQILRSRIRQNGLMYGEGVLEILPDGFGFLRSPEYNYLPCPDDIYISARVRFADSAYEMATSFRARFVRPKNRERYFALLRVEAINGEDPERITDIGQFRRSHAVASQQAADS